MKIDIVLIQERALHICSLQNVKWYSLFFLFLIR